MHTETSASDENLPLVPESIFWVRTIKLGLAATTVESGVIGDVTLKLLIRDTFGDCISDVRCDSPRLRRDRL